MRLKKIIQLCLPLLLASTTFAANPNYVCPDPSKIRSTDFTAPSIWVADVMPRAKEGTIGVGLGGKRAVALLGVEEATVSHKKGWVCVYRSEGGTSVNEYARVIRHEVKNVPYLTKYADKVEEAFEKAQPYLEGYPKDEPLGFVGYQLKEE